MCVYIDSIKDWCIDILNMSLVFNGKKCSQWDNLVSKLSKASVRL